MTRDLADTNMKSLSSGRILFVQLLPQLQCLFFCEVFSFQLLLDQINDFFVLICPCNLILHKSASPSLCLQKEIAILAKASSF